jgi:hypothetical protein
MVRQWSAVVHCGIVMTLPSMSGMADMSKDDSAARWGWFLAWLLVGACGGIGVAAILTVGVLFVLLAAAVAVFLLRKGPRGAVVGGVSGLALPLCYLAYLNRSGPGDVCRSVAGGQTCVEEYAPVPFLLVGLLLVAAGLVVHAATGRRTRAHHMPGR